MFITEYDQDFNLDFIRDAVKYLFQMTQGECLKCEDRGDVHGIDCIVRKLILKRDFRGRTQSPLKAMESAVLVYKGNKMAIMLPLRHSIEKPCK